MFSRQSKSLKTHFAAPRDTDTVSQVLRRELQDIAVTIVHARRDVASLKLNSTGPSFAQTTDDLDTVVAGSERATGDILTSVERLQDVGLRLRSKGIEPTECEAIEAQAITILRACSSQDITGQRVSRIVNALRIIEQRVAAALDAIIASEGGHQSQSIYDLERTQTQTHGQSQAQSRPAHGQDSSWVTPAADQIIRSKSPGETEAPFERSVARTY